MTVDEVWSWPSAIAAVIAGVLYVPFLWFMHFAHPTWNSRALPGLIFVDVIALSFGFTISQVLAAWWVNDHGWVRIMSRYGMWVVMAIAIAVTLYAAFRVAHRRRHHA